MYTSVLLNRTREVQGRFTFFFLYLLHFGPRILQNGFNTVFGGLTRA